MKTATMISILITFFSFQAGEVFSMSIIHAEVVIKKDREVEKAGEKFELAKNLTTYEVWVEEAKAKKEMLIEEEMKEAEENKDQLDDSIKKEKSATELVGVCPEKSGTLSYEDALGRAEWAEGYARFDDGRYYKDPDLMGKNISEDGNFYSVYIISRAKNGSIIYPIIGKLTKNGCEIIEDEGPLTKDAPRWWSWWGWNTPCVVETCTSYAITLSFKDNGVREYYDACPGSENQLTRKESFSRWNWWSKCRPHEATVYRSLSDFTANKVGQYTYPIFAKRTSSSKQSGIDSISFINQKIPDPDSVEKDVCNTDVSFVGFCTMEER